MTLSYTWLHHENTLFHGSTLLLSDVHDHAMNLLLPHIRKQPEPAQPIRGRTTKADHIIDLTLADHEEEDEEEEEEDEDVFEVISVQWWTEICDSTSKYVAQRIDGCARAARCLQLIMTLNPIPPTTTIEFELTSSILEQPSPSPSLSRHLLQQWIHAAELRVFISFRFCEVALGLSSDESVNADEFDGKVGASIADHDEAVRFAAQASHRAVTHALPLRQHFHESIGLLQQLEAQCPQTWLYPFVKASLMQRVWIAEPIYKHHDAIIPITITITITITTAGYEVLCIASSFVMFASSIRVVESFKHRSGYYGNFG